mgnify:CR=1 FL=1
MINRLGLGDQLQHSNDHHHQIHEQYIQWELGQDQVGSFNNGATTTTLASSMGTPPSLYYNHNHGVHNGHHTYTYRNGPTLGCTITSPAAAALLLNMNPSQHDEEEVLFQQQGGQQLPLVMMSGGIGKSGMCGHVSDGHDIIYRHMKVSEMSGHQMPGGQKVAKMQGAAAMGGQVVMKMSGESTAQMCGQMPVGGGGGVKPPSRYESQKRRDWNTFGQYLQSIRPGPLPLAKCSGEHVLEFLRYLDRFGKTQIHQPHCPHFGLVPSQPIKSSSVSPACECPLRQAWGSLDALIGRLRAAFEENGGKPELNPFGAKIVRIYLRNVRDLQAKARGIAYQKKTRKRPRPSVDSPVTPTDNSPVTHSSVSTIEPTNIIHPQHLSNRYSH